MQSLLTALAFLTILPIRFDTPPTTQTIAQSRYWYPVAGLLLAVLLGAWAALVSLLTPLFVATFLVLAAWVVLTGALHIDGFMDLCDGLFAGETPEDRLRIMKDPHVGAFGLVGGVLLLLGKFVVLQETLKRGPGPLVASIFAARCLVVSMAAGARYPRLEGTGKVFVEACGIRDGILLGLLAAAGSLLILLQHAGPADTYSGLLGFVPALVVVLALRQLCISTLGGITGDCLGAGIELAEWAFLLGVGSLFISR